MAGTQFRPLSTAAAAKTATCVANPASAACTALSAGFGTAGAGLQPNSHFTVLQWFNPATTSNYNAAILTVRRNVRGVQLSSSYTYSRCLDYGSTSTPGIDQAGDAETYLFPLLPKKYNYGPCAFNITQNWTTAAVIPLPFHGNQVKEGWQVAIISSARTGTPETAILNTTFDQANLGQFYGTGTVPPDVNAAFTGLTLRALNKSAYAYNWCGWQEWRGALPQRPATAEAWQPRFAGCPFRS